jgi:CelD/BcsL family acetyltransferase involved in cellulose biosynthesis
MPVRFEISSAMSTAEVEAAWLDLESRASPHFFLSWDWVGCWIEEASLRPAVLIGRVEDRIVLLGAMAPSTRRDVLPIGIHGLQLHAIGDLQHDIITIEYNGFLVDRDWAGKVEADAIAFLLGGVVVDGQRRDELHLRNIPADLELAVAACGYSFSELQRKPSWRIDLAAVRAGGKQYLECLSANTRQQIRRSMRLYERRGPLTAMPAGSVPEALTFLGGLKELHQRYWTARGEPGAFAYPYFERFQKRLIRTCLPHGTAEILRISAGPDVIGYVYNFLYRGHVYAYQSGFHYEYDPKLKPGLVSHCLCIDQHRDAGSTVYDFMAGDARYKSSLGEPGPDMLYLLAERPTWPLQLESILHGMKRRLNAVRQGLVRPDASARMSSRGNREPLRD